MKKVIKILITALIVLAATNLAKADQFWGSASVPQSTTLTGPVLFKLDTATGTVGTTYTYSDWNIIMDVTYAPGHILYAVHNTTGSLDNFYNFKLAKVDAATGAVLSDTLIKDLTGTDEPQWNALEYHDGKLYAVENCWTNDRIGDTGSAYAKRGYIYEVGLNGSGDPISATLGAYIGGYPAPDGALAYRDGTWYASDWRDDAPHASSWIKTTTDIMNTNFTATLHTEPIGYFDGWDFEADGDLLGVSWYSDFNVYKINLSTGNPTAIFNIQSQLPSNIESLSGLTAVSEPPTVALVPNALYVNPGATVTVSVNMTVSSPITMAAISTRILYDPNVFTYDPNSGVVKGNLLTNFWDLAAGSPAAGELRVGGIDLGIYPEYFETLAAGSGKLFTFSLKAKEDAPRGPSALTWGVYNGYDNATAGFDYGDKDFIDVILPLEAMSGASISVGVCPAGDLDGDCDVDFHDLAILAGNWLVGT